MAPAASAVPGNSMAPGATPLRPQPPTGLTPDFIRRLGLVPSYYLRYYYAHDAVVAEQRGATTRAEQVARLETELLELYADPALDRKPAQLSQRGGAWYSEAAVDLLVSLTGDRRDAQVVNTVNGGTLPFLPDDAVIEVPAVIGSGGAAPAPVGPVDPLLRGLIAHVYAYEELALDAAIRGGRDRVYDALLAHPLVGQADRAQCLADRLIAENALSRYRVAEGQNVFGSYGHSGLTPAMRRVEAQLASGQLLPDTENRALKSPDRFKERLADLILRHPDKSAEELSHEVHDGIRYAFIFDTEHYAEGTLQVHSRLKGHGFELEARWNGWESREYKGINSRWRDPAHDLVFEVQFHTASSWDVWQQAHDSYQRIIDPEKA